MRILATLFTRAAAIGAVLTSTNLGAQTIDWQGVATAMGRPFVVQAPDVYRFNFPRSDMKVTVDGVAIKPSFALGGWVAMKQHGSGVMAMGDFVLADTEVNALISRLQAGGIEQTAVHNHVLREAPRVVYVHIHAMGDPVKIAETVRAAVALTAIPAPQPPAPPASERFGFDTAAVARALQYSGRVSGGVYQVGIPRAETIRLGSFEVPPTMGLATAINFQPTGQGKAAIAGDFVLRGSEVNPVIRILRANSIEIAGLHSHLIDEEPRLYFMHFWANDDAVKLARSLRLALDATNSLVSR